MITLAVSNQKGGVGKSTLAVLLAHWLVDKQGQRVAVLDLDNQCNASKVLHRYDCGIPTAALFDPAPIAIAEGADAPLVLFPGTKALADAERGRADLMFPAFREQVAALGKHFDVVVIDTPPNLGLRMGAALFAAHHVLCPIELEEFSLDGVTDMLKTIFGMRQKHNPRLQLLGILPNRFNPHSLRQREALENLIANYAEFVVPTKISTRSAIPEALTAGVPVWRLAKSSARDASAEVLRAFELLREKMGGLRPAGVTDEG